MFARHKTYRLYRQTKTKTLNIAIVTAMLASSLSSGAPLFLTRTAIAESSGGAGGFIPLLSFQQGSSNLTCGSSTDTDNGSVQLLWGTTNSNFAKAKVEVDSPLGAANSFASIATFNYPIVNTALTGFGVDGEGAYVYKVSIFQNSNDSQPKAWATCTLTYQAASQPPAPNQAPSAPKLAAPSSGTVRQSNASNQSSWHASTDPEGDAITYVYQSSLTPDFASTAYDSSVSGPNPLTNTFILNPGEPEVTYYWRVKAIDAHGAESAWSEVWSITIDNTAPAAPTQLGWTDSNGANVPDGGYTNLYSGTASWQPGLSGDVNHYIYKYWNNIPSSPHNDEASAWTTNVSGTELSGVFNQGEGAHYFCVAAADTADNLSACSTPFAVTYDATPPDVTISGSVQSGNVIQPNVTAADPSTPLSYSWTTSAGVTVSDTSALSPTFTVNQNGAYKFDLTVTDAAGNSTTVPFTFTYTAPPQPQIPQQAAGGQPQPPQQPPTPPAFTNVLGANTRRATPNPAPPNDGESDDNATNEEAQVLSASTFSTGDSDAEVEYPAVVANTQGGRFLGLGWWWAAVPAALSLFWLLLFGRRRNEQ